MPSPELESDFFIQQAVLKVHAPMQIFQNERVVVQEYMKTA